MNETNINRLEIEAANVELTDDILQDLLKPVSKRKGFKYNNHVVTIPRYFYRIIGVKRDKEGYCENLCRNHRELSKLGDLYSKFDKGLNKDISIEFQNLLNGIWGKCKVAGRIDTSSLISLINEYSILKLKVSDVLLMQVKNNFKGILDYYLRVNDDKNAEDIRLIVYYCIHWLNKYLTTLFSNFNYKEINPKIIYYGDINKAEAFFLVLLASLGCDILYYNPEKRGELENIDKYNTFSKEVVYVNRMPIVEFPEVVRERIKTTAYNAKEDLNKTL